MRRVSPTTWYSLRRMQFVAEPESVFISPRPHIIAPLHQAFNDLDAAMNIQHPPAVHNHAIAWIEPLENLGSAVEIGRAGLNRRKRSLPSRSSQTPADR